VAGYIERGRGEGNLIVGGDAPEESRLRDGFFIRPALFDDVPPEATIAQEEIFGPVLAVTSFETVEEAYTLAEGTSYGLVAAVWTRDLDTALWLARELRAGQVLVNSYAPAGFIELPFGGFKLSGHGREKGLEALHDYTQTKAVAIKVASPW
jgi:acyl-CoA reductase-like NAD-dependent aldehyde dehydrogenase